MGRKEKAANQNKPDVRANQVRNASSAFWGGALITSVVACCLSIAAIVLTALAFVKYDNLKKDFQNAAPAGSVITVDADDIRFVGIAVLTLDSVICLFLLCTIIWLCFNKPDKPSKGFYTSAASLYIPAYMVFYNSWLLFGVLIAYTKLWDTQSAEVKIEMDGTAVNLSPEVAAAIEQLLGVTTAYKTWDFLKNGAGINWALWVFALLAGVLLFGAAGDGSERRYQWNTPIRGGGDGVTVHEQTNFNPSSESAAPLTVDVERANERRDGVELPVAQPVSQRPPEVEKELPQPVTTGGQ